jgi:hypothetical protein
VTAGVMDCAAREGDRRCLTAALAIAGRALVLLEDRDDAGAREALAMLATVIDQSGPATYKYIAAAMLRPFVPEERTYALLTVTQPWRGIGLNVLRLRALLPLEAFTAPPETVAAHGATVRELADDAAEPSLRCFAEWADAVLLLRSGERAEGLRRGRAASEALAGHGEHYTAARLEADLVAFAGERDEALAGRLVAMGAHASAAQARGG